MRINNAEHTLSGGTGAVFITGGNTIEKIHAPWVLPKQCWLPGPEWGGGGGGGVRFGHTNLAQLSAGVELAPCLSLSSSAG